jgi:uncharacterized protein (TIGR02145 family)
MKKQLAKLAAALGLAITLTFTACEEKQANTLTDTRDNKTYKTVKIGTQIWMAENLNFEAKGSMCYDNKPDNCQKYGRLYDGEIAKKACPSGWHLPSKEEWEALETTAGGNINKLKAKSGWEDNENGTDEYGFSALPGGKHGYLDPEACDDCEPSFWDIGYAGRWWSSTESGIGGSSYSWYIGQDFEDRDSGYIYKASLRSVRCIKD